MTGAYLFEQVRIVLRDNGRGVSTTARTWTDDEISSALMRARQDTLQALFALSDILGFRPNWAAYNRAMLGGSLPPSRARVTIGNMLKTVAFAAPGAAAPDGFWRIECGVTAAGKYLKTDPSFIADPMQGVADVTIYARGQRFFGPTCTVYYWRSPTNTILNDATDLSAGANGLSDAFYETAMYRAISYLLQKERAEYARRAAASERIFKQRLSTLR